MSDTNPEEKSEDLAFDTDSGDDAGDGNIEFDDVLPEEEIDDLLEFDGKSEGGDTSGIRALINSSLISYERLPMLENVFDTIVRRSTSSLREFTSDNVDVSLDNVSSIRFGDFLNSVEQPSLLAVARSAELSDHALVSVDNGLSFAIIDALLGGQRNDPGETISRPYTSIETSLIRQMIEVFLRDVTEAFQPVAAVSFQLARLENNPRFAMITRANNAVILAKFRIEMDKVGGRIHLLIPYGTLEPIRKILLQQFMGEKFGRDEIWETHLASQIGAAELEVETVLTSMNMRLGDVQSLKPGQTMMLDAAPDSCVDLLSGGVHLVSGRMGRVGDKVAIRLEDNIQAAAALKAAQAAMEN